MYTEGLLPPSAESKRVAACLALYPISNPQLDYNVIDSGFANDIDEVAIVIDGEQETVNDAALPRKILTKNANNARKVFKVNTVAFAIVEKIVPLK